MFPHYKPATEPPSCITPNSSSMKAQAARDIARAASPKLSAGRDGDRRPLNRSDGEMSGSAQRLASWSSSLGRKFGLEQFEGRSRVIYKMKEVAIFER